MPSRRFHPLDGGDCDFTGGQRGNPRPPRSGEIPASGLRVMDPFWGVGFQPSQQGWRTIETPIYPKIVRVIGMKDQRVVVASRIQPDFEHQ